MIPILYEKDETAFISNGLGRLRDLTECVVSEERNGLYECSFSIPLTSEDFPLIQIGRIIGVTHDDSGDVQPFDIVSYERPIEGIVTFHAVHISYRQSKITATLPQGLTSIDAVFQQFVDVPWPAPNPFSYYTNKTSSGEFLGGTGIPKSIRQYLGGTEGSLLDCYGGEYEWDKFNVKLLESRGRQRDFQIRYGVNMANYEEQCDISENYSSCVPYWTDGSTTLIGGAVESGRTTITGRDECVPLDLSDKFESKPSTTKLRSMALSVMKANNTTVPTQNIHVEFVRLQDSPEYGEFDSLLRCNLCDTIQVIFPDYNSSGWFKIVKTVWNVLRDRYDSMELGDLSMSLSEALGVDGNGESSGLKAWQAGVDSSLAELETIGDVISESGTTSISIPNNTWKTICHIDVPPGRWLMYGRVRFQSNATGRRFISISTTDGDDQGTVENNMMAVNGSYTYMTITAPRTATTTTRYYLVAQQSSGGALATANYGLSATRMG